MPENRYLNVRSVFHTLLVDTIFIVGLFSLCLYCYWDMNMSYIKQPRLVIIIRFFIICFCVLSETQLTGGPNSVDALTDEQREEIEKLRAQLNTAFVKDDKESIAAKGVIVQPGWTEDSKTEPKVDGKVVVTAKDLAEVKALRAEINKAVSQNTYAASYQGSSAAESKTVQLLVKQFGMESKGKAALESVLSSTASNAETVGAASEEPGHDGPNIVEAADIDSKIDPRKLQRLEVSKRRTKERLILKSIEEDFSFDLGDDVEEWEHILHDGHEFFIGRREKDLLVVRKDKAKYEHGKVVQVGQHISYLETYSYWNTEQRQQEGVILVATHDKIRWYCGDKKTGHIEFYWEWVVGTVISGLTHFTAESNDYLVVSSNESSRTGYYTLNIYQFELHTKEFWIAQRLQLRDPCGETTLLDTGRDIILAVPQNNTAVIYGFNPHADASDHIRFQLRHTYASEGIESVAAFQMGGRSYLALGGEQPQILLYQQGEFVPKTILSHNFGLVQLFFPVPVRTYRDDLLLLVQHRVDFGTHGLTVVETLIWDGEAFEASIPVPCKLGKHTRHGATCMLDLQRDEGLKGAALLRRGNEVSIIVPRHNAESGLFRLHTELLGRNSELLDLEDIFKFLKDWVKEQDDLIAQAIAFVQRPATAPMEAVKPDFSELQTLNTPQLIFNGEIAEIYINDYMWTEEDSKTNLDVLMNTIEALDVELTGSRRKRDASYYGLSFDTLDFDDIEIEQLLVECVNNEKFYIQHGALEFDGLLSLSNLEILADAQDRAAEEDDDDDDDEDDEPQVEAKDLTLDGDMEFVEINGVPWYQIKNNLVLRNDPFELRQLDIDGEVIVEDRLTLDNINSLNFPADFLWSGSAPTNIVSAEKTFMGTLSANTLETMGPINGVNPRDAITLSDTQNWQGMPTFKQLEVIEIELNGTAKERRGIRAVSDDPTLAESKFVTANCNFENLEVRGSIHLNGNFDDKPLGPKLADVVQRPDNPADEIHITSKKSFETVAFPIDFKVLDGRVNNIRLNDFVTLNTRQELDIESLEGYVFFNNLSTGGLYDGVDIVELSENSIKIDEPQNSPNTQLNFVQPIKAQSFNILNSLNSLPIATGYQTLNEDINMPAASFTQLEAKVLDAPNDIHGDALLNGKNLHTFMIAQRWSDPSNAANIYVDALILPQGLEAAQISGIESAKILSFLEEANELPEMLIDGKIRVDHVIVTGDVQVNKLNGHSFDEELQLTVIWLNRPNYLSNSLQFMEPLKVLGNLTVEADYNGQNLEAILDDFVYRSSNGTALILAPKSFTQNVRVLGNTYVDAINSVPFIDIATKQTMGNYKGSLQLNGNLIVNELVLSGYLNDYSMAALNTMVRFDAPLQAFVLQGVLPMSPQLPLNDLTIYGDLNDLSGLQQFFANLVYRNDVVVLKGNNTFTGRVSIKQGLFAKHLNGHNLPTLLNNVVFTHDTKTTVVDAPVEFRNAVNAPDVTVRGSVTTTNLAGCSLEEWLRETLRVDKPQEITRYLQFAPGSLNGNAFYASYLNDIDLSQIITLHTEQNISNNLLLSELYLDGQITTKGLINDVDLQYEYNNTLLTHGNQHVSTPLTMQSLVVLQNLITNAPVNSDKELQEVATLQEGTLSFKSPLYFQNVATRNLQTNDLVSGIDLSKWFRQTLRLQGLSQQWITGNWSARSLTVKSGPALPSNMANVAPQWAPHNSRMRMPRNDNSYEGLCQLVARYMKELEPRAYHVKQLEEKTELNLKQLANKTISRVFELKRDGVNYLIFNTDCWAQLYKWNESLDVYEKKQTFETGVIAEVVVIPNGESASLYFAINTVDTKDMNCSLEGLNAWELNVTGNVSHSHSFERSVTTIHTTPGESARLYAIDQHVLHELSPANQETLQSMQLPKSGNASYRFVPTTDLVLSNGEQLLLLKSKLMTRERRASTTKYSLPLNYQRTALDHLDALSMSILKPNATIVRKFSFSDFKHVVENILNDLIYRLSLEVNITQLSIPESDLYDEYLMQDFVDIMQELQAQQIFPEETFSSLDVATLHMPESPGQVLAARTIQIIWPVIVEIEEVHNYLRDNSTSAHPVCACITNSLGRMVSDMLLLANGNSYANGTAELTAVIERILIFQKNLEAITAELNLELKEEQEQLLELEISSMDNYEIAASELSIKLVNPNETAQQFNGSWTIHKNQLPPHKSGEILNIQVGGANESRYLLAVIVAQKQPQVVAGPPPDVIRLYTNAINASLFQTIHAEKPRSLAAIRIRDESLLAYIEGCCNVRVLIYRGVEGFVEFSNFKTDVEILHLISLSLPSQSLGERHFLGAVLNSELVFYEVLVTGARNAPKEPIDCN